ncbi:MAG: 3-deoxy-D-manno-octulosonic acid transferase [Sedimentisphaerales bacterium]|nr:3-deoxy-D-manno-octulosonic acid transferase [Sedimentisphaerales bacterium]
MRLILDLLYLLGGLLYSPVVVYRMVRHRRYRHGWDQRFGRIARTAPEKRCIWLHAVSVGEVNAAKTLLTEIEKRFGDYEIIVSTTTDTGFARAQAVFGSKWSVCFFPFDFSWVMARAFRRVNPALCLLMELEVWPNFIRVAQQRDVPVVVVNGRISDRGFKRYCWVKPIIQRFFSRLTLVLAQTTQYAERFRCLGCPAERVVVTSSLKYDTAPLTDHVAGADVLARQLGLTDAPLWVAGGTGNDEEKIVLGAYKSLIEDHRLRRVRLAVVPRKPERFNEVAQLIAQMGLPLLRYSQVKEAAPREDHDSGAVILGDTMGDLRKFYSLATVIFVGRSLVPMGGSDMMEAAALGKCTLFGPHTFNFRQTVDALLAGGGAVEVKDEAGLLPAVKRCLLEPDYAQAIAQRGRQVIKDNQGATARTIQHLVALLLPGETGVITAAASPPRR